MIVVAITFWDLIDIRLPNGDILKGVWRILAMNLGESDLGRWERLVPRRRD